MPADLQRRPSGFVALVEEMQLLFDSFHVRIQERWPTWRPAMDLLEDADSFLVLIELPGVPPEKVEVSSSETRLRVRGVRQPPRAHFGAYHHHIEGHYGHFERLVVMPKRVDPLRVTNQMRDGVLTVILPKK
jgi:HSP20 family protein